MSDMMSEEEICEFAGDAVRVEHSMKEKQFNYLLRVIKRKSKRTSSLHRLEVIEAIKMVFCDCKEDLTVDNGQKKLV